MRKSVYQLLSPVLGPTIPASRFFQFGSITSTPARPFAVYRLAGKTAGVTSRSKIKRENLEVWIHDDPGSYSRIEGALSTVEGVLDNMVFFSAGEGDSLSSAVFVSRSPDMNDTGFGTICKSTNYQLTGE